MTAKEAIQQELGDLFKDFPTSAVVQDEVKDLSGAEGDEESIVDEGEGFYDGVFEFEEQGEESSEDESGSGREGDEGIGFIDLLSEIDIPADYGDNQPREGDEKRAEEVLPQMTKEEIAASIEAANEAMDTTKMSPESLDWGLDFLKKMYQQQNEQLRARLAQIDRNAARARYKAMADEEEARENADREQFLRG